MSGRLNTGMNTYTKLVTTRNYVDAYRVSREWWSPWLLRDTLTQYWGPDTGVTNEYTTFIS